MHHLRQDVINARVMYNPRRCINRKSKEVVVKFFEKAHERTLSKARNCFHKFMKQTAVNILLTGGFDEMLDERIHQLV